jgi:hypothetical protein
MISDNRLWDSKSCDDVIENEKCCSFSSVVECRHRLGPFREIIHGYNNVSMPPDRVRVTGHEIDTPFSERSNRKLQGVRERDEILSYCCMFGKHGIFERQ